MGEKEPDVVLYLVAEEDNNIIDLLTSSSSLVNYPEQADSKRLLKLIFSPESLQRISLLCCPQARRFVATLINWSDFILHR